MATLGATSNYLATTVLFGWCSRQGVVELNGGFWWKTVCAVGNVMRHMSEYICVRLVKIYLSSVNTFLRAMLQGICWWGKNVFLNLVDNVEFVILFDENVYWKIVQMLQYNFFFNLVLQRKQNVQFICHSLVVYSCLNPARRTTICSWLAILVPYVFTQFTV